MNRVTYEYWKSAVINQTAHAIAGAAMMALLHFFGDMEAWKALISIWVLAWAREWEQDGFMPTAFVQWRKHNDAMWFVIGGFLLSLVAS